MRKCMLHLEVVRLIRVLRVFRLGALGRTKSALRNLPTESLTDSLMRLDEVAMRLAYTSCGRSGKGCQDRAACIIDPSSMMQADHFRAKLSLPNETVLFSRNEDDKKCVWSILTNHGAAACRCRIRLHSEHSRNSFLSCPGKPNLTWHWQAVVDSRQAISVLLFLL